MNATLRTFWATAGLSPERVAYSGFQARRYSHLIQLVAQHGGLARKRVLDLGGGNGSLSVAFHATFGGAYELADYQVPSPTLRAALAAQGVGEVRRCDLTGPDPLAGLPNDYDVVVMAEVIEHLLVNPLYLFHQVWDHTRTGGWLLLSTPNPARLTNRWRLLRGRSIKDPARYPRNYSGILGHVVEYGRAELDQMVEAEGYRRIGGTVVQNLPTPNPSRARRWAVRRLNGTLARRFELGDEILALYEKVQRAPPAVGDSGYI